MKLYSTLLSLVFSLSFVNVFAHVLEVKSGVTVNTIRKAFAKKLSAFIAPEYLVSGLSEGDFSLRLQLITMFPPSQKSK